MVIKFGKISVNAIRKLCEQRLREEKVEVRLDLENGLVWFEIPNIKFNVAIRHSKDVSCMYSAERGTFALMPDCGIAYFELPCSRVQAKEICAKAGWRLLT
jgi:hypothetical protein